MSKNFDPEFARKLFAGSCDFVLAADDAAQFPNSPLPEVALIGRSNVGKSSLVNALTGRKNLARASNTPGRTQQIIFFDLGKKLMLADLPGYGHARAPREVKDHWNALVQAYLRQRPKLVCVCLLIDGRHGILANDIEMMKFLDRAGVSTQIVLTKIDHVKPKEREERTKQTEARIKGHPVARESILATSSDSGEGMKELREFLAGFV